MNNSHAIIYTLENTHVVFYYASNNRLRGYNYVVLNGTEFAQLISSH